MPATAGKQDGTITFIDHNGTQVDHQTTLSLDINQNTIECSTKNTGRWDEFLKGTLNASGSGEFFFAEDATEGFAELLTQMQATTNATIRIATTTVDDSYYEFTAIISNLSQSASRNEVRSCSFSWQNVGVPTFGTVT